MPELTVILPVYNGWPHVRTAVESVLAQTYKDFILLIINDGSTDETAEYLKTIKDRRVRIVSQENRGLGSTLNRALSLTDTPFVARMDADDFSDPQRFEKQINLLKSSPDTGACGTSIEYFSKDSAISGYPPPLPLTHKDIVENLLLIRHALVHPTLMMKFDTVRKTGFYRFDGIGEDWDFFIRLTENTKVVNLEEKLYCMRLHKDSVTWRNWEECRLKNEWAVASHNRRKQGEDIEYKEFLEGKFSDKIKILKWKIFIYLDAKSLLMYRRAIIAGLKRNYPGLILFSFLSVLAGPWKLARRIKKRFVVNR